MHPGFWGATLETGRQYILPSLSEPADVFCLVNRRGNMKRHMAWLWELFLIMIEIYKGRRW